MNKLKALSVIAFSTLALSACDTAQEQLGLEKTAPDEFKVVKRAPLEMPPNFNLRAPAPGAPRPQEQRTVEQAKETVFGEAQAPTTEIQARTAGEGALLQQAGAGYADPSIREKVDAETSEFKDRNKAVVDKLLDLGGSGQASASVVDASKEAERLRKNKESGKPVTEGETPSIEE